MGSLSLWMWIEISISGFFYLLALFFIILKVLGVKDLVFLSIIKDYAALLSVGIAIASYLLGILAHRLLSIIRPFTFIKHLFKRKQVQDERPNWKQYCANLVKVWQYGSERLHRELDSQYSLNSLMRLLVIGIPLSGLSIALWIWETSLQQFALLILMLSFVLGLAFYLAYRIQRKYFEEIVQAISDEMKLIAKTKK